jgi:outer membrane lipoprotein SlyB
MRTCDRVDVRARQQNLHTFTARAANVAHAFPILAALSYPRLQKVCGAPAGTNTMTSIRFTTLTPAVALCAALSLSACVAPGGTAPYGAYPAQQGYAQPSYAQPAYPQPTYAQPTYAQPGYAPPSYPAPPGPDGNGTYQGAPAADGYGNNYGVQYGVVSSIQPLSGPSATSPGSVAGTVVGAVVGGLLGNQIGRGHGRDAATVVGALGGAVAGHQIGQQYGGASVTGYRIAVTLSDGSSRAFDVPDQVDLRPGDRVRIDGNRLDRY